MKCKVDGCNTQAKYKGLCGMHYKRQWRHGDVNTAMIPHSLPRIKCTVDDCDNLISHSNGLCKLHEQRLRRYGRTETILAPKGSGYMDQQGYIVKPINGEKIYEHREIAERALGKPLPPGAVVHHVNGKPWDNRPENLVICPSQEYHLLLHRRMKELGYEDN